ncbi:MAG TPA: Rieske (2Fe-2S) protein [Terriglobia bacterium]|nr:Rieske (2Fe-2S) protein [Terriglobia bacterium]
MIRRDDSRPCDPERRDLIGVGGCFLLAGLAGLPVFSITGLGAANEKQFPLPQADSVNIDRKAQVILVREHNAVYAFALSCPHENAAVKWLAKDHRFQCSKHDSKYQPDGVYTAGRATRNLDRFAVRREGETVVVDLQHWFQSDKDPAGWKDALIRL